MFGRTRLLAFLGLAYLAAACSTYRSQLARGERAFETKQPDRALAILRDLEPDFQRLTPNEQATYAYVRGMTDFEVGYKADARHWLSVANAYEQVTPGALPGERKTKTIAALKELNDIVYQKGTSELVNVTPVGSAAPAPSAPKADKKPKPKPKAPANDTTDDQD